MNSTMTMTGFEIGREERENHKGFHKACLYYNGRKVAVCKDGRTRIKDALPIPQRYLDALAKEWSKIEAEEGPVS